jgi:hypothetical protein
MDQVECGSPFDVKFNLHSSLPLPLSFYKIVVKTSIPDFDFELDGGVLHNEKALSISKSLSVSVPADSFFVGIPHFYNSLS